GKEILSHRLQAGGIREARELDAAELLLLGARALGSAHDAARGDGDVGDVRGNLDSRADLVAVARGEHALVGDLEVAVACVADLAARQRHGEEAFAVDTDVERTPRRFERALARLARDAGETRAASDLNRRRRVRLGAAEDRGALEVLIEEILE